MFAPIHVDLGPDAKGFEIEAGFNRKTRAWQQPAIVMSLVIVHVDAVAVHRLPETVPGPMHDAIAVALILEHGTRCLVHFPSPEIAPLAGCVGHEANGSVARIGDGAKGARHLGGRT